MIEKQVIQLLEEIGVLTISDTSMTLAEDLGFDSLKLVMLLVLIEDSFEIELDESDMNPFELLCVEDVVQLVKKYVAPTEENNDE